MDFNNQGNFSQQGFQVPLSQTPPDRQFAYPQPDPFGAQPTQFDQFSTQPIQTDPFGVPPSQTDGWGLTPTQPTVPAAFNSQQIPEGWGTQIQSPYGETAEPPHKRIGTVGILVIVGSAAILLAILGYVMASYFSNRQPKEPIQTTPVQAQQQTPPEGQAFSQSQESTPTADITADQTYPSVQQPSNNDSGGTWAIIGSTDGFTYVETVEAFFLVQGVRIYADMSGGGIQIRHVAYGTVSGYGGGAVYEIEVPRTSEWIDSVVPGYAFTIHFDVYTDADGVTNFLENLRA